MGKKGLADKVRAKRKDKSKPAPNPFEVKVNKVKHVVVNKRVQSWEKGIPGVSRSKAIKKRKDTLLRELHHSKKSNSLLDKRFGEGDNSMSADEKMVQRFALEKKKQMRAADFNLDDNEEILTHYGQSLAENLQDTIGSGSDDDDDQAVKNITGDLQFGGLSRDESGVSWKDKMKDIIADSKKLKYERQAQKEKVVETTNELDSAWKSVAPSLRPVLIKAAPPAKKTSNYMQLFHNLMMEQKSAGASDKLKTDEEKAKEEAERLQVLEAQRLSRMRGDAEKPKSSHVSADDLNDGFAFENTKNNRVSFSGIEEDGKDSAEESEDDNNESSAKKRSEKEEKGSDSDDGDDQSGDSEGDDDDDDDEEEESDNFSDLASDEEEDEEEDKSDDDKGNKTRNQTKAKDNASVKSILKQSKYSQPKPLEEKQKAASDLPFVFAAPGSYEELASLLHGHSADEQATIVSRLRKCHHPSLAEGNKDKLEHIYQYLLEYYGELTSSESIDTVLANHIIVHIWELSQMFPATIATHLQKFIVEQQRNFTEIQQKSNGRVGFVDLDVLIHLSLIGAVFPTSDYRHPVTTPTICFISQVLAECSVRSIKDCVTGLYLCAQALEFVNLSKRYIPEVLTFMHGLLALGVDEIESSEVKVFPPLKINNKVKDMLQVCLKCDVTKEISLSEIFSKDQSELNTDSYKCEVISRCVQLLLQCLDLWAELPDLAEVVKPIKEPLSMLPVQNYPDGLNKSIQQLKSKIRDSEAKTLCAMQLPMKKPEPLKLFEPKIEEFWSGKKKKGGPNREANERQRLTHKLKREMKAAVREIKRDNEVLATHQLEVIAKKDIERKRKTKALMNSLANQEGDYKAIKRGKPS